MQYTEEYWKERFNYYKPIPEEIKTAIKKVYSSYPHDCMPQGNCDPMYIMNIIAHELGIGDGKGTFFLPGEEHKRVFICFMPAAISYGDRAREEYGDYKKLASLLYDSLELIFYADCPQNLREFIKKDAKQYKKGQKLIVSSGGQAVILGMNRFSD
jgi:hypothetical protein